MNRAKIFCNLEEEWQVVEQGPDDNAVSKSPCVCGDGGWRVEEAPPDEGIGGEIYGIGDEAK